MSTGAFQSIEPCVGECRGYRPGHAAHFIQIGLTTRSPWGWRDARVTAVEGLVIRLAYLLEEGEAEVWHHRRLDLEVGDVVALHEQFHVLRIGSELLNVAVGGGLGAVPEPEDADRRQPGPAGVVDLRTGIGIALDGNTERWRVDA